MTEPDYYTDPTLDPTPTPPVVKKNRPRFPIWRDEKLFGMSLRAVMGLLVAFLIAFVAVVTFGILKLLDQGNAIADLQASRHQDRVEKDRTLAAQNDILKKQVAANANQIRNLVCFVLANADEKTALGEKVRKRYNCPAFGEKFVPRITPGVPDFPAPPSDSGTPSNSLSPASTRGSQSNKPRSQSSASSTRRTPAPALSRTPIPTRTVVKPGPTKTQTTTVVPRILPSVCASLIIIKVGC